MVVGVLELHASDTAGGSTHRSDVVLVETDRHAVATHHEDVVASAGLDHTDEFVAVAKVDRDEAVATARVVGIEGGLLDGAIPRGEEQEALAGEVTGVDDRLDLLVGLQRQQVDDRHALGRALAFGNLERPQTVDLAAVREEQQVSVRCGEDHVTHDVVDLHLAAGHATTAATLGLERVGRHRLDVLGLGHHDDQFLVVDEIFDRHLTVVVGELAHARRGELVLDRGDLVADDGVEALRAVEDLLEIDDLRSGFVEFGLQVEA